MAKKNLRDMINKAIFIEEEYDDTKTTPEVKKEAAVKKPVVETKSVESKKLDEPMKKVLESAKKVPVVDPIKEVIKEPVKETIKEPVKAPVVETYIPKPETTKTVISHDTKISGNISSKGDLEIAGDIEGNIFNANDVRLDGQVKGNIKAVNFVASGAKVVGDIKCEGTCSVLLDSSVEGNIDASDVIIKGHVIGNISSKNMITLGGNSILEGNIATNKFVVEEGAVLEGSIQTLNNKAKKPQ